MSVPSARFAMYGLHAQCRVRLESVVGSVLVADHPESGQGPGERVDRAPACEHGDHQDETHERGSLHRGSSFGDAGTSADDCARRRAASSRPQAPTAAASAGVTASLNATSLLMTAAPSAVA